MISQDAPRFHPLKLSDRFISQLLFHSVFSAPSITVFPPGLLIQLPPLMHSMSAILCLTHTNTNFVSWGHMLTRGGPEYSHLPAFPMSHRARVWENVYQIQYGTDTHTHTHTHTHRNHTRTHMLLTPSLPLITPRQPAHLMLTVTR